MEAKIRTLHPQGKKGVTISREKYETMKKTILDILRKRSLTHDELVAAVVARLTGAFQGSIPWYMESTKLDLEARGSIERVPGDKYEFYRLKR